MKLELTSTGYLHISAEEAARFPTGTVIVLVRGEELWLMPMSHSGAGGLLLKIRNSHGDRSVFVQDLLPEGVPPGFRDAVWDDRFGAIRIPLLRSRTTA
ncbi:hydrogenase maturation protease [Collibacillus ludicampi]|uniref:Hydrogenase maturation protease n=1 Tax=Collibacillus ludicampi TaxID=2771369 RepID=A0AAV4LJP1_9BACL|nr:hydrogenase maturation protease [Collibacillus ludicampi]GIM47634.1 hydrogenase maturation protease [Collibacillus ludicampi]